MNRDDIIRMAREAGLLGKPTYINNLESFAALVVSAERDRIKQANAPEIERINTHIKELEDAVKKALAQPKQEPVAWIDKMVIDVPNQILYTAPQRTWVGLTEDEREEIALEVPMDAVLITEAKLKEKNT